MKRKRLHILVGSSLFAILLWAIVTMREEYQTANDLPLIVENIPEGKALRTVVPRHVQLKYRGDGWRLAALILGRHFQCVIDLNTLPPSQAVITLKDVVDRISIPSGVQVLSMRPESVFIAMDRSVQKMVPVLFDHQLSFRDGYGQVGAPIVTPESVRVEGAEAVLRFITSWRTVRTVFENVRAPVDANVPLADTLYQLRFWPQRVHIHIGIQPFAEKSIAGIPVEVLSVPTGREIILIPPKVELVVRGGIEQLSALSVQDFRVGVDYNILINDTTGFIDPVISPPPGVQVVSRRPDRVQFVVRRRL
jgi:YbbR domain-containing protein